MSIVQGLVARYPYIYDSAVIMIRRRRHSAIINYR